MTPRPAILIALAAALLLLPLALGAHRLRQARERLESSRVTLAAVGRDVERIESLRDVAERVAEHQRPEQDVITRVSAVLQETGLPADRFSGVRLESDAPLPGRGSGGVPYRRQSMRVSFQDLTLPQLGQILSAWHVRHTLWTPSRIELSSIPGRRARPGQYNAAVVIAATYIGDR